MMTMSMSADSCVVYVCVCDGRSGRSRKRKRRNNTARLWQKDIKVHKWKKKNTNGCSFVHCVGHCYFMKMAKVHQAQWAQRKCTNTKRNCVFCGLFLVQCTVAEASNALHDMDKIKWKLRLITFCSFISSMFEGNSHVFILQLIHLVMDYRNERRKNIRQRCGGLRAASSLSTKTTWSLCPIVLKDSCSCVSGQSQQHHLQRCDVLQWMKVTTHKHTFTHNDRLLWMKMIRVKLSSRASVSHESDRRCCSLKIVSSQQQQWKRRANSSNDEHHQTILYANCRGDTAHNRFVTINELNRFDDVNFVARIHKPNTFVSPIRADGMRITRSETKTFANYRFRIIRFRRQGDNRGKKFGHQIDCQCV